MEVIVVDFDNVDPLGRIRLEHLCSGGGKSQQGVHLSAGTTVLLDDRSSLKNVGLLHFSNEEKIWVAEIDWNNFQEY